MVCTGKLAAFCRSAPSAARSLGIFSTAAIPLAASRTLPTPARDNYTRFLPPMTILPPTPLPLLPSPIHRRINDTSIDAETSNLVIALKDLYKEEHAEINKLQWMLESLRIARFPSPSRTNSPVEGQVLPVPIVPTNFPRQQQSQQQQQQQKQLRTFQAMNRNARKAKRANHGKRPCSRIRRRYKVKAWANTSRKG